MRISARLKSSGLVWAGAAWSVSVHGHQLPNVARSDDSSRDTDTWLKVQTWRIETRLIISRGEK